MAFYDYGWAPRLSVAERREKAKKEAAKLAKKGRKLAPVAIEGRKIATTFWGQAWCANLEAYANYQYRLPRGRSYARNGSVIDLAIARGGVSAVVVGSEVYEVQIGIARVTPGAWKKIAAECAGRIDSLVDLLAGELSAPVMEVMTRQGKGLFPTPAQITFQCTCPDYADVCKHVAAALYGVGARLDREPALLFLLRGVDHRDLIASARPSLAPKKSDAKTIAESELGDIFGIELGEPAPAKRGRKR